MQLFDFQLVGVAGFEPTTPCSQSRCANQTAPHPEQMNLFKCETKVHLFFLFANARNRF